MEREVAVVEHLVHREVFLQYLRIDDANAQMARQIETCLKEEAAQGFLLPFVCNNDSVFRLVRRSTFDETGDSYEPRLPLLDGFCDNRYFFIGIYVAETPGIIWGWAEG